MDMERKKEDRRIRRTKRLLRQSLAELMNEKEFKDITVKEITERADLNRGTFYFHYADTYDLKNKVEDELVETFAEHLDAYKPTERNHSVHGMVDAILSCIEEDRFIVKTLLHDHSGESLRTKFMYVLERTISRVQMTCIRNETEQEQRYICRFLANGAIGVIAMWLEDSEKMTRKQLTNILDDLIGRVFPVTEI